MLLYNIQASPGSGQIRHYKPFWDISGGQWWREILPVDRTLSSAPDCSWCLERKTARNDFISMGSSQWFGQMVRVLEGAWLGNGDKEVWLTKIFGEEVCGQISPDGQKNERVFVFHVNAHQRVISAEEDINNQLDRMTCSVDTGQPLSPVTLSSPRGLMNKVTMVAGTVVTHRLSNMDSIHQRWPGYGHCWVSNLPAAKTNMAPIPSVTSQPSGSRKSILTASIMEGAAFSSNQNRYWVWI